MSSLRYFPRALLARIPRLPRRIRFTRAGTVFTGGSLVLGLATVVSGNNLIHLLLGAMLGIIAVSGWLSERNLRGLSVRRTVPRGAPLDHPVPILYHVHNRKRWLPSFTLHLREAGLEGAAFVASLAAGEEGIARSQHPFQQRGVYPLQRVVVSTAFPFGLFTKERDLQIPGELVVWPRTDRPVPPALLHGGSRRVGNRLAAPAPGARGEYRALREYRTGDDVRDIHWRATARRGAPVMREYEGNATDAGWICLSTRGQPGDEAELVLSDAASLAAHFTRAGRRFGFQSSLRTLQPATGRGHLERILDLLARADFDPDHPVPVPPSDGSSSVLFTLEPKP